MLDPVVIGQISWTSLATTSYYALFAVAFALVLKVNRLFNFTQAAAMTIAFYAAYSVVRLLEWPSWAGLVAAIAACLGFSWVVERFGFAILRRRRASVLFVFIFTFIVSEFVAYLAMLVYGTWPQTIFANMFWPVTLVGGVAVSAWDLPAIGASVLCIGALLAFMRFTRWGQFMVAVSDNPDLAELYGIEQRKVYLLSMSIAGVLVAVGMFLYGSRAQVQPMASLELMLFATVAAIVGGIGNILGAALAAVALGFVQNASVLVIPSELQGLLLYVFLFLAIVFFPGGLKWPRRRVRFAAKTREFALDEPMAGETAVASPAREGAE